MLTGLPAYWKLQRRISSFYGNAILLFKKCRIHYSSNNNSMMNHIRHRNTKGNEISCALTKRKSHTRDARCPSLVPNNNTHLNSEHSSYDSKAVATAKAVMMFSSKMSNDEDRVRSKECSFWTFSVYINQNALNLKKCWHNLTSYLMFRHWISCRTSGNKDKKILINWRIY